MATRLLFLEEDIKWECLQYKQKLCSVSFFSDLQPLAIFQFKLNAYIVSLLCKAVKKEYERC